MREKGTQVLKRSVLGFGLKLTVGQREYYRYTGISAEVQRHGFVTRLGTKDGKELTTVDERRSPDKQVDHE